MSGAYLAMSTSLQTLDDATLFAHACLIVVSRRHTSHMDMRLCARAGSEGVTPPRHITVSGARWAFAVPAALPKPHAYLIFRDSVHQAHHPPRTTSTTHQPPATSVTRPHCMWP